MARHGRTVLFVSHNLGIVKNLCQRSIVLSRGKLVFDGTVEDAIDYYVDGVVGEGSAVDFGVIDLNVAGRRAPEFTIPYVQRVMKSSLSPIVASIPIAAAGNLAREHTFVCDIPSFSLVPGDYMLNVSLVVRGKWIDCVDNAARFSRDG